ncbi:hypothetical protein R6Q59_023578 [Mikania micrantha]
MLMKTCVMGWHGVAQSDATLMQSDATLMQSDAAFLVAWDGMMRPRYSLIWPSCFMLLPFPIPLISRHEPHRIFHIPDGTYNESSEDPNEEEFGSCEEKAFSDNFTKHKIGSVSFTNADVLATNEEQNWKYDQQVAEQIGSETAGPELIV